MSVQRVNRKSERRVALLHARDIDARKTTHTIEARLISKSRALPLNKGSDLLPFLHAIPCTTGHIACLIRPSGSANQTNTSKSNSDALGFQTQNGVRLDGQKKAHFSKGGRRMVAIFAFARGQRVSIGITNGNLYSRSLGHSTSKSRIFLGHHTRR